MISHAQRAHPFFALLAATLGVASASAQLDHLKGPSSYVGVFGGITSPENGDANDTDGIDLEGGPLGLDGLVIGDSIIRTNAIQLGFEDTYYGGLAIGRDFGVVRAELEGAYRPLEYDSIQVLGSPVADSGGEIDIISLMGNVYIDIPVTSVFELFFGGGVGLAYLESRVDNEITFFNATVGSDNQLISNGNDVVWAFQAVAGAALKLGDNVTLSGGVRYFTTADPVFERAEYNGFDLPSAELGLRFSF